MRSSHDKMAINWLKRPTPYADESLAGFLGRWARENVLLSRGNLLNTLVISRAILVSAVDVSALALPAPAAQESPALMTASPGELIDHL